MDDLKMYDKILINTFTHIPAISFYNHSYYIGLNRLSFKNDLLFAESDDDNTTVWYLVTDKGHMQIGYSNTSDYDNEHINYYTEDLT